MACSDSFAPRPCAGHVFTSYSGWASTCTDADFLRVTPGCSITVATGLSGCAGAAQHRANAAAPASDLHPRACMPRRSPWRFRAHRASAGAGVGTRTQTESACTCAQAAAAVRKDPACPRLRWRSRARSLRARERARARQGAGAGRRRCARPARFVSMAEWEEEEGAALHRSGASCLAPRASRSRSQIGCTRSVSHQRTAAAPLRPRRPGRTW